MNCFIFICDGWGSKFGGINSLNYDFVMSLGDDNTQKVICLCANANRNDIEEAKTHNVILINSTLEDIIETRNEAIEDYVEGYSDDELFWVGHDIKTGFLALNYKKSFKKGKLVLFNHMDYNETYKPRKDSKTAKSKRDEQDKLFKNADYVFAVGPKLFESAKDRKHRTKSDSKVFCFLPGLVNIEPIIDMPNLFSAISFGRIEKDNDIIKQNNLAIRAFSKLSDNCNTELPTLLMLGIDSKNDSEIKETEDRIKDVSNNETISYTNIYSLPYTENRDELFNELRSKSASMMLSLTEGFGLVGLESISAGIPLIISTKSGLYKHLKEKGLDLFVSPIDVKGANAPDKNEEDIDKVYFELKKIYNNGNSYKRRALSLRKELIGVLTWENSVRSFLKDLGVGYLDFEYDDYCDDVDIKGENDLISRFKKRNFRIVNNDKIIKFDSDKFNAFETNSFYDVVLQASDKYLWIWGRKNSKLFSIDSSNDWFFNELPRRIENGFDFRCLFLNPNSKAISYAQKDRVEFKEDLKTCIRKAREKCGDNFVDICKHYNQNRDGEVIVRVDNYIILSPIYKDGSGLPEHLTGTSFYITSIDSVLGKELLQKFESAWNKANYFK